MSVIIENVRPEIDGGRFAIKRVSGEKVKVTADIFTYGKEAVSAKLLYYKKDETARREVYMKMVDTDRYQAEFLVDEESSYYYTIEAWIDEFKTFQKDLELKADSDIDIQKVKNSALQYFKKAQEKCCEVDKLALENIIEQVNGQKNADELLELILSRSAAELIEKCSDRVRLTRYPRELCVIVERQKALFSSWYEMFPRSCANKQGRHGKFSDCENLLPEIAKMGFDVLYFPPIHPIGITKRRGRNNSENAGFDDAGNPWSIGSGDGGHKAVHPELGSIEDFERLVNKAREFNIEVALDIAFQCSADHPYIKEHPEWFKFGADGAPICLENPPKLSYDIIPFNFDIANRKSLWNELKSIVEFWISRGVKIFRVDMPYLEPFAFWEWLIREIKNLHPDVIFLAEAFARQKKVNYLSKVGFTQSYTYFCWRNTKKEIIDYVNQLINSEMREFFRPNFWPNSHNILPENLQFDGRQIFMIRFVLAATLSSNYGIFGPAYELCVQEAIPGKEEYNNSEKYEIKNWDWNRQGNIREFISKVNKLRKDNPALQTTWNIKFHEADNDNIIAFSKTSDDLSNIIYVVINLDPHHTQSGWVKVPISDFKIEPGQPYLAHDLLGNGKYVWNNEWNYVELNPYNIPAHIINIKKKLKKETDENFFSS